MFNIPAIMRETPRMPTTLRRTFMTALRSKKVRVRPPFFRSDVLTLCIKTDLSSRGSRRTMFAYWKVTISSFYSGSVLYVSREQWVNSEGTSFALVIGSEDNEDVLDADHERESPNNQRQRAKQVIVAGLWAECRGVHIERTGADIAIDDANWLVGEPKEIFAVKFLFNAY